MSKRILLAIIVAVAAFLLWLDSTRRMVVHEAGAEEPHRFDDQECLQLAGAAFTSRNAAVQGEKQETVHGWWEGGEDRLSLRAREVVKGAWADENAKASARGYAAGRVQA